MIVFVGLFLSLSAWAQQSDSSKVRIVTTASGERSSDVLTVERTGPSEARLGQTFEYQIKIANVTDSPLTEVVATETGADSFKFISATPAPESAQGKEIRWNLGNLAPRETRTIKVNGTSVKEGPLENCMTVRASCLADRCLMITVVEPKLQLTKTLPAEVLICEPIPVRIVVKNNGSGTAENVKIEDNLPQGLITDDGKRVITDNVGALRPGESHEVSATLKAEKSGDYNNTAVATAQGDLKAEATAKMVVREPILALTKIGPAKRYYNLSMSYEITLTNKGNGPARNTILTDTLPAGLTFISATEGGRFADGQVVWNLGTLESSGVKKVSVTVKTGQMGTMRNLAKATAQCTEASAELVTEVVGVPGILLEMVDVTDPIQVGDKETYIITVTNQGTAPDNNVRIVCTIPDEEEYVSGGGVTNPTVAGKVVTFAPLATLPPREKAVWQVVVKAIKAGDVRFKTDLTSDMLTGSPVYKTESTHIFGE